MCDLYSATVLVILHFVDKSNAVFYLLFMSSISAGSAWT